MTKRKDGQETRGRLLNVACKVFAQKGYRKAMVADICKRADANVAAVNYYFGGKAGLYAETWRYLFEQFEKPLLAALEDGSPQEQLRQYIQILLKNYTARGKLGYFSRLYMTELLNPTGLIQDMWHELVDPRRKKLQDIVREIIGPEADHESVLFCEVSIVNQCRVLSTVKHSDLEYFLEHPLDAALIKRLADHIVDFSLAGIRALGKRKTSSD
jgi:AcrR family transcriptional regulator